MTAALKLAALSAAREAEGRPENLTELIHRVRFAAEWNQKRDEVDSAASRGFYAMSKDEGYTLQQREDALYSAAALQGEANVRRDAARTLDSIADALVALCGDPGAL